MLDLYFILAGVHMVAVAVTGILWTVVDLVPTAPLKRHDRDIRAVHFGSLYLALWFLGLAFAFEKLHVQAYHQVVFPAGLAGLLFFASLGYFPQPEGLDPLYSTTGRAAGQWCWP
jgi:hypothetical protein